MCVLSMVMDWKYDEWMKKYNPPVQPAVTPNAMPTTYIPYVPLPALPTADEIAEFRNLLERAREYDKRMNQPDCELEEKRDRIKALAKELGVDVSFV